MIDTVDLSKLSADDIIVVSRDLETGDILKAINESAPEGHNWIIFCDDPKNAIHLLTEEDLNQAGYYRKDA